MTVDVATTTITGKIDDDGESFGFLIEAVEGAFAIRVTHNDNTFQMDDDGWMTTHPTDGGPSYTMPQERLLALEDELLAMIHDSSVVRMFGSW